MHGLNSTGCREIREISFQCMVRMPARTMLCISGWGAWRGGWVGGVGGGGGFAFAEITSEQLSALQVGL